MSGTLSHLPSLIIRQLLIDLELGSDHGSSWPMYGSKLPDSPDNAIAVIDRTGRQQGRSSPTGEAFQIRGIQIVVRSNEESAAWAKGNAIETALSEDVLLNSVAVTDPEEYGTGSTNYTIHNCKLTSSNIIKDPESDRRISSLNFLVQVKET